MGSIDPEIRDSVWSGVRLALRDYVNPLMVNIIGREVAECVGREMRSVTADLLSEIKDALQTMLKKMEEERESREKLINSLAEIVQEVLEEEKAKMYKEMKEEFEAQLNVLRKKNEKLRRQLLELKKKQDTPES